MRRSFRFSGFFISSFATVCLIFSPAFAKNVKRYTIESGEVHYKIEGSSDLGVIKTSSTGTKDLYFKDYGLLILEDEKQVDQTTGMESKTTKTHKMTKTDKNKIYTVNFDNKFISVMNDPALLMYQGDNMGKDAEKMLLGMGGKKLGSDNVLGYKCNIWELMGVRQCLYKDQVPLWLETNMMGVKSKTTAVSAKFNKKVSNKHFKLPNFPVKDLAEELGVPFGGEGMENMSSEEQQEMQQMAQALQQAFAQAQNQDGSKKGKNLEQQMMESISNSDYAKKQLEEMKRAMPLTLMLLKKIQPCIKSASSLAQAQSCEKKMMKLAKKYELQELMDEGLEITSWSSQEKTKILSDLDEGIKEIEKALPCIKRAKNIIDLGNCYEQ